MKPEITITNMIPLAKKYRMLILVFVFSLSGCFNYENTGFFAVKTECNSYPTITMNQPDPQLIQNSGVFMYEARCKF